MRKKSALAAFAFIFVVGPVLLGGCEPDEAQDVPTPAGAADSSDWRQSPDIQALYQEALAEGAVHVLGFDRRDVNWIPEAVAAEFPGIQVRVSANLSLLPWIMSGPAPSVAGIDVVQASLMEANALNAAGYLTPVPWSSFGVAQNHQAPGGWFGYTNNIVYTVAYDRRRVPGVSAANGPPSNGAPIPARWEDLVKPEFRGRLSTNSFVLSRLIAGLGLAWGESEAQNYARARASLPGISRCSAATAMPR